MSSGIKIDYGSQIPVYKQIIEQIEYLVKTGKYEEGHLLPSMNELSGELNISKETVKKAYSLLRNKNIISATQGKGFYVSAKTSDGKLNILVLFDKLSTYKQVLFSSFASHIGEKAEITIHLHNQNVDLFDYLVSENLDLFDYYVVTPHFPLDAETQRRAVKILTRIPNRKLIMVDRYMSEMSGNFGAVYQDYTTDAYEGLTQGLRKLRRCSRLNVISMPSSLYSSYVRQAAERFCNDNDIDVEFHNSISPEIIRSKEVYLILNSQLDTELIELVREARAMGYKVGRDISIISYNESPINEIILNGLTTLSTDFKQMGELAAKMILEQSPYKVKCDFHLIKRSTF